MNVLHLLDWSVRCLLGIAYACGGLFMWPKLHASANLWLCLSSNSVKFSLSYFGGGGILVKSCQGWNVYCYPVWHSPQKYCTWIVSLRVQNHQTWHRSLCHHYRVTWFNFQHTVGTIITILEIWLSTQDFTSGRLPVWCALHTITLE
jgi:hypothetical protein